MVFTNHSIVLKVGDQLLPSTNGITKAFNPAGEEFGEARLIAAAQSATRDAHLIRTAIMSSFTAFAEDNFHDDASLLIVQPRP